MPSGTCGRVQRTIKATRKDVHSKVGRSDRGQRTGMERWRRTSASRYLQWKKQGEKLQAHSILSGPQPRCPLWGKVYVYLLIFRTTLGLESVLRERFCYFFYSSSYTPKWMTPQIQRPSRGVIPGVKRDVPMQRLMQPANVFICLAQGFFFVFFWVLFVCLFK